MQGEGPCCEVEGGVSEEPPTNLPKWTAGTVNNPMRALEKPDDAEAIFTVRQIELTELIEDLALPDVLVR